MPVLMRGGPVLADDARRLADILSFRPQRTTVGRSPTRARRGSLFYGMHPLTGGIGAWCQRPAERTTFPVSLRVPAIAQLRPISAEALRPAAFEETIMVSAANLLPRWRAGGRLNRGIDRAVVSHTPPLRDAPSGVHPGGGAGRWQQD